MCKTRRGDIIQRCTSDVEVVRNFIAEQMVELLSTTFLIVVYMAAMFTMNVKISLFVFAFIPVIVSYSLVFYKRISKGYQKADEAEGELSSDVQENITGVRVVRAFAANATSWRNSARRTITTPISG